MEEVCLQKESGFIVLAAPGYLQLNPFFSGQEIAVLQGTGIRIAGPDGIVCLKEAVDRQLFLIIFRPGIRDTNDTDKDNKPKSYFIHLLGGSFRFYSVKIMFFLS